MASVKVAGLISIMGLALSGPSLAETGTEAQREACTPDAFRLCMSAMPDSGRVEGCLRAAGPRLSPACYAVFNPPQADQMMAQGRDRRPQREMQQRDRYDQRRDGQRDYDQPRDLPSRNSRDGLGGPPNTFDDD